MNIDEKMKHLWATLIVETAFVAFGGTNIGFGISRAAEGIPIGYAQIVTGALCAIVCGFGVAMTCKCLISGAKLKKSGEFLETLKKIDGMLSKPRYGIS